MKRFYKILFVILLLLSVSVFIYHIYNLFNPSVRTQIAVKGVIEEVVPAEAVVIRDEEIVLKESDVIVSSIVLDGERVAKGKKLADLYYGTVVPDVQAKLREVNEKLTDLNKLSSSGNQQSVNSLDSMIKGYAEDIVKQAHKNNGAGLYKTRRHIDEVMNRKIIADGESADAVIQSLKQQQAELEAKIVGDKREAYATRAGLYFSSFDGYEGMLGTETINNITPSSVKEFLKTEPSLDDHDATMKITDGYNWYIALSIDEGKLPSLQTKMQSGMDAGIKFVQFGQETYPVQITHISEPEDGQVAVVLKGSAYNDAVYYNRFLNVELVLNEYEGLKFFKEAIKVNNEKTGVFVMKNDGVAQFKEVEVLSTDGGYAVVREDNTKPDKLLLYDEVIITRDPIADGDVVK